MSLEVLEIYMRHDRKVREADMTQETKEDVINFAATVSWDVRQRKNGYARRITAGFTILRLINIRSCMWFMPAKTEIIEAVADFSRWTADN